MKTESRSEDKQVLTGPGQKRSISDDRNNRMAAGEPSKAPVEQTLDRQQGPDLERPRGLGIIPLLLVGTIRCNWCVQEVDMTKWV